MSVRVSSKLKLNTRTFEREVEKQIEDGMEEAAKFVERKARQLVPVDTGRLRASIDYELEKTRKGITARIYADTEYAIFVEMGTRYMDAQPYLRPALFSYKRDIMRKVTGR